MGFWVRGDYFEACTCAVSCPCIFLSPATEEGCDLLFAWHVDEGTKDGVTLDGLNVALAVRSARQMSDGGWTAALYLDDRSTERQAGALGVIFSGQAGGHLANVAPLIGTVAGIWPAPISFERAGPVRRLRVGDLAAAEVAEIVGMDGVSPSLISNPLLGAIAQPLRQARSTAVRYDGVFAFETSGSNGFVAEFAYENSST
jgi:hypothetical protein